MVGIWTGSYHLYLLHALTGTFFFTRKNLNRLHFTAQFNLTFPHCLLSNFISTYVGTYLISTCRILSQNCSLPLHTLCNLHLFVNFSNLDRKRPLLSTVCDLNKVQRKIETAYFFCQHSLKSPIHY
jgi:hypothetical protein